MSTMEASGIRFVVRVSGITITVQILFANRLAILGATLRILKISAARLLVCTDRTEQRNTYSPARESGLKEPVQLGASRMLGRYQHGAPMAHVSLAMVHAQQGKTKAWRWSAYSHEANSYIYV